MLIEMGIFTDKRSESEHMAICTELHEILEKNNNKQNGDDTGVDQLLVDFVLCLVVIIKP